MTEPGDGTPPIAERMRVLWSAVTRAVTARRSTDPGIDDPFRGLYLSHEQVDSILSTSEPLVDPPDRLAGLAVAFGLGDIELTLLTIALAPDLDARFERLYGYLNDDVTRRRATVGLALELAGLSTVSASARALLQPSGRLVHSGLICVEDGERPALGRTLRVPDRVCLHLLGGDEPDPALRPLLGPVVPTPNAPPLPAGSGLIYLRDKVTGCAFAAAIAARPSALALHLDRLPEGANATELATVAGREAGLRGVPLIAGPIEAIVHLGALPVRAWADLHTEVLLVGSAAWQPEWSDRAPLIASVAPPAAGERVALWQQWLGDTRLAPELDLSSATAAYRFSPGQIAQASAAARAEAERDGGLVTTETLRVAARTGAAAGLERLARRITPAVSWDDLILPAGAMALLHELVSRVRHRDRVLGEWRMRPGGGRGTGVTGLFAGDSGTGKTMAAEAVAGALGLDLYVVDLSTVVDKYVGETEKNLSRIFDRAETSSAVLLFDEADALFAKRGAVSDAHDRYANVETAYLLQRMESFDGVALLTTNLRANLDEAFLRRLDVIVDFPRPDAAARLRLWRSCLASGVPTNGVLDLDYCAKSFELSGGSIRAVSVTAAYLAAEAGRPVALADLVTAVQREYRKLGRLLPE